MGLSIPPDPRGRPGDPTVNIWTNRLIEPDLVLKGADVYRVNQTLVPTSWAKPDSLVRNSSRKALCAHKKNANLRNWKCWFLLGEMNVTNISIKAQVKKTNLLTTRWAWGFTGRLMGGLKCRRHVRRINKHRWRRRVVGRSLKCHAPRKPRNNIDIFCRYLIQWRCNLGCNHLPRVRRRCCKAGGNFFRGLPRKSRSWCRWHGQRLDWWSQSRRTLVLSSIECESRILLNIHHRQWFLLDKGNGTRQRMLPHLPLSLEILQITLNESRQVPFLFVISTIWFWFLVHEKSFRNR